MNVKSFLKQFFYRRRSTDMIVRKTDDELARFMKQSRIIERRQTFERQLSTELLARKSFMNTFEIRQSYYDELASIHLDKSYSNENLNMNFLSQTKTYKPLGQRFRLIPIPQLARHGDWSFTRGSHYLLRILGGIVLLKLGHLFGSWDASDENFEQQKVVWMETEDQIFDELINKNKTAVFLEFYSPGHTIQEKFNKEFEKASHKYSAGVLDPADPSDEVVFMRVHCRKHINFCTNKMWSGRIVPAAELYFINEEDKIQLTDFGESHRSQQGIQAFFERNGVIEDKTNPERLLERAGRAYLGNID